MDLPALLAPILTTYAYTTRPGPQADTEYLLYIIGTGWVRP